VATRPVTVTRRAPHPRALHPRAPHRLRASTLRAGLRGAHAATH
jgi:hypothetical protein